MPSLNCTEVEQLLREAAESRRDADAPALREHAGLRAHAMECDACRGLIHEQIELDRIVAAWKRSLPSVELVERAIAGWRGANTDRPHQQSVIAAKPDHRPASRALWAAASLAGIVLAVAVSRGRHRDDMTHSELVHHRSSPTDAIDFDPSNDAATAVETRGADVVKNAYLALANDAASAVSAGSVLLPVGVDIPTNGPPSESGSWIEDMSRELKPVATKLGTAFEFLIDALPQQDSAAT